MTDLFCCELSAIHSNGSQPSNWPLNWAPLDLNPTKNYHRKDDWIYLFWLQEQQRKQIIVREPLKIEIFFFFFYLGKIGSPYRIETSSQELVRCCRWWIGCDFCEGIEMRWDEEKWGQTRRDETRRWGNWGQIQSDGPGQIVFFRRKKRNSTQAARRLLFWAPKEETNY